MNISQLNESDTLSLEILKEVVLRNSKLLNLNPFEKMGLKFNLSKYQLNKIDEILKIIRRRINDFTYKDLDYELRKIGIDTTGVQYMVDCLVNNENYKDIGMWFLESMHKDLKNRAPEEYKVLIEQFEIK